MLHSLLLGLFHSVKLLLCLSKTPDCSSKEQMVNSKTRKGQVGLESRENKRGEGSREKREEKRRNGKGKGEEDAKEQPPHKQLDKE